LDGGGTFVYEELEGFVDGEADAAGYKLGIVVLAGEEDSGGASRIAMSSLMGLRSAAGLVGSKVFYHLLS
jgi:hypothetical protein